MAKQTELKINKAKGEINNSSKSDTHKEKSSTKNVKPQSNFPSPHRGTVRRRGKMRSQARKSESRVDTYRRSPLIRRKKAEGDIDGKKRQIKKRKLEALDESLILDAEGLGTSQNRNKNAANKSGSNLAAKNPLKTKGKDRQRKNPKLKKVEEVTKHPLSIAFNGSLDHSTACLLTSLISRLSNTQTSLQEEIMYIKERYSTEYIITANKHRQSLLSSAKIILDIQNIRAFRDTCKTWDAVLHSLFEEYEAVETEIMAFAKELGTWVDVGVGGKAVLKDGTDGGRGVNEEIDREVEEILHELQDLGKKWYKKMEDSEKKLSQQQARESQLIQEALNS